MIDMKELCSKLKGVLYEVGDLLTYAQKHLHDMPDREVVKTGFQVIDGKRVEIEKLGDLKEKNK